MTIGRFRLSKEIKNLDAQKETVRDEIPGSLGITIGGTRLVENPNRPGFVKVRLRDNLSETVDAYNDQVSPIYDLPVIVVRDKKDHNRWRIKERDLGRYSSWGSSSYLPNHAGQHSFDPSAPGADIVWVYDKQFMPLAATPSGSSGAMSLIIKELSYYRGGTWHYFPDTSTSSYVSYKPSGTNSVLVLTYLNTSDTLSYVRGSEFAITTGTANILPNLPALPNDCFIPIVGVYLLSGTSYIDWNNIYPVRPYYSSLTTGSSGGVTDHGALTGLLDNDHPQYMLTGTVSGTDEKAKVSSDDTTADYLENKLVAGSGISLAVVNSGGNEQLRITNTTGTSSTDTFGTLFPLTPPVQSDFSWVNQVDATVSGTSSWMTLHDPANVGVDWHLFVESLPTGTAYKREIGFIPNVYVDYAAAGMVLYDSNTGKFIHFSMQWRGGLGGASASVCAMTDIANWSADYATIYYMAGLVAPMFWFQIEDTGVDRYYRMSLDGKNYRQVYTHATDTFLTPNKVGFGVASYQSNGDVWATILHYKKT